MHPVNLFLGIILCLFSGFCYRLRGSDFASDWPLWLFGKWKLDRLMKLAIGSLPLAIVDFWLQGPSLWIVFVLVFTMFANSLGHFASPGKPYSVQVVKFLYTGMVTQLPLAIAFTFSGHINLAIGTLAFGALKPIAYVIGGIIPFGFRFWYVGVAGPGTGWGEWINGFLQVGVVFL